MNSRQFAYFEVGQKILEVIWRFFQMKRAQENLLNPWYFLERKTGFEPATPTLARG
jgi:hypothetical protein